MNYQYRHGTGTMQALRTLYADGGFVRFYRGLAPALVQAPLARFGDTASNAGALALLGNLESTKDLPVAVKTVAASSLAALCTSVGLRLVLFRIHQLDGVVCSPVTIRLCSCNTSTRCPLVALLHHAEDCAVRIVLVPIDTVKTIMQVEGKHGLTALAAKFKKGGPSTLFHGALASAGATFVGVGHALARFSVLGVHPVPCLGPGGAILPPHFVTAARLLVLSHINLPCSTILGLRCSTRCKKLCRSRRRR